MPSKTHLWNIGLQFWRHNCSLVFLPENSGAITIVFSREIRQPQNLMLLLSELADQNGQVRLGPYPEVELQSLMAVRFEDCRAYQLPGGAKR
jgi:hypothetical protein